MAGILGLNSASIFVADLPRHVDFYTTKLGFTVVPEEEQDTTKIFQSMFASFMRSGAPE